MKLREYLNQQNVPMKAVGKVLITFKIAAWSTWVLLVPICGKFQPIRRLSQMSGPQRLKAAFIRKFPNRYERWEEHVIRGSEWFASKKSVRWIPDAFGQKHRDFGLSIAEATVLYKLLFPIWAPLEFVYIVRFYKKKWGVTDLIPIHSSEEYSDSYAQASDVNVLSLDMDMNQNGNSDDDDDERNDNGSGGASGGYKSIDHQRNKGGINHKLCIHTCSSSLSHLIGFYLHRMKCYKRSIINHDWNSLLNEYRYGHSHKILLGLSSMTSLVKLQ